MNSPEMLNLLEKRIRTALAAVPFPPPSLGPFEDAALTRTLERIGADDRLRGLFARLEDDDSLRRTFLSVYFHVRNATP